MQLPISDKLPASTYSSQPKNAVHARTAVLALAGLLAGCCKCDDNAEDAVNAADRVFITTMAHSNNAAIAAGSMGWSGGASPAVQQFGFRIYQDYNRTQTELKTIVEDMGELIPDTPHSGYKGEQEYLNSLAGRPFDTAFMNARIRALGESAAIMQAEVENGNNIRLKSYAVTYLPWVRRHEYMADSIRKGL